MMDDQELLELLKLMAGCMARMDERITAILQDEGETSEIRSNLELEHELLDKMKALFESYKSTIECQAMLEAANEELSKKLSAMETRVAGLESRVLK